MVQVSNIEHISLHQILSVSSSVWMLLHYVTTRWQYQSCNPQSRHEQVDFFSTCFTDWNKNIVYYKESFWEVNIFLYDELTPWLFCRTLWTCWTCWQDTKPFGSVVIYMYSRPNNFLMGIMSRSKQLECINLFFLLLGWRWFPRFQGRHGHQRRPGEKLDWLYINSMSRNADINSLLLNDLFVS